MRLFVALCLASIAGLAQGYEPKPLICPLGNPVAASIGSGVVMRSCVWEKAPGERFRTGPLLLIKNGVLILKTQTNANGRLHGLYEAWSDDGELQEKGNYVEGRKDGAWTETDEAGMRILVNYTNGAVIEP